ncbi:glutamate-5-semialdehyde dehydrogenase [Candidatus Soleaferrea massiliensis]|uniref:glutamate-5-semialdehyde dehydrogenase n=1 Tax=Candidatus Soleaferrea massiliensis TaxID=1470354 RepID=UPI00058EC174|nr:glutamate-5-semialdehyde dehydrogenase [Candidatus Soleaferrea massiliensis]
MGNYIDELGKRIKKASKTISVLPTTQKNAALLAIADALTENQARILEANALDIARAQEHSLSSAMIERLTLNENRIQGISDAVKKLVDLDDPVGIIDEGFTRPNGLQLMKTRVPLGVVGVIYESRPNVTVDTATLCLKSGNCVLLRGGKEAFQSNKILTDIMRGALKAQRLPEDAILLVEDTSREIAAQMMKANDYLDVLIPRGGAGLIGSVVQNATVPVIQTGAGNCHVYIDEYADLDMAVNIVENAKTHRVSVCNAIEGILVHQKIADAVLPMIKERLERYPVELIGCERTRAILGGDIKAATDADYATEYLDYKLSVKVVDSIEEAMEHIDRYSTKHSECIVTESYSRMQTFTKSVDAAVVYVNASTRFTDGGEFGYGAEIGISTQKLHARGPMGLHELTTIKYIAYGNGQIRE